MLVFCVLIGLANILIARMMDLVVRAVLSFMWRQMPTRSSMYPSTHPKRGMLRDTSAGSAGSDGVVSSRRIGVGIVSGGGCVACVCFGFQKGLLMMLFPRFVRSSISVHHYAGLNEPPNVRLR